MFSQRLGLIFEFADLTSADVSKAAALHWADFEDAVQSVTAERIHANYIITRNVRDFTKSSVMAFTPAELLGSGVKPPPPSRILRRVVCVFLGRLDISIFSNPPKIFFLAF